MSDEDNTTDQPSMNIIVPDSMAVGHPLITELAKIGKKVKVFLDGEEQKAVIFFDKIEGVISRYVIDEDGKFIVEDDRAKTEVVKGDVTTTVE